MIKNKNIIVTGGAGFIGSHLFDRLMLNSNFVIIIDNFSSKNSENEKNYLEITKNYEIEKDYLLFNKNLLDNSIFKNIDYDIDYIFHLAAIPGVRHSIQNAMKVTENNIVSTINIFEYAINTQIKKVIYASSSSVYGNPIYTPVDEEHPKNPISPYAVSKLCCETYADYYFREYRLPVTSLRFYTVYGPRGRLDMAIRKFFINILQNRPIEIYGDGNQLRDFTYISDIIEGLVLAAESNKSSGEIFNLGYSNPISINDLVEKIYKITDKPKSINKLNKEPGDVDVTYSKIEKARKILSFVPKTDIDRGLQATYEWQLENL